MSNNATCAICNKGYYMCNSCRDFKNLYPWKLHTDTSEHFKIYQIIHGYSIGVYNKAESKEKLQNVDLSDLETLRDNIKAIIKDILYTNEDVQQDITKPVFVDSSANQTKKRRKVQKSE